MSLEAWVQFKIWGVTILNFVMMSIAIAYLMKKGELETPKRAKLRILNHEINVKKRTV